MNVKINIIVNFITQKLKNKHTILKKYTTPLHSKVLLLQTETVINWEPLYVVEHYIRLKEFCQNILTAISHNSGKTNQSL